MKPRNAGEMPGKNGFAYRPQWAVLIVCTGEEHQKEVFERLRAMGYDLKVLTV